MKAVVAQKGGGTNGVRRYFLSISKGGKCFKGNGFFSDVSRGK
jgi:hypothetical protein